jgi:hypothetical protein
LIDRFSYSPVFVLIAMMPLVGTLALFTLGRKYRTLGTSQRLNVAAQQQL